MSNLDLMKEIWNEKAVAELLGVERKQLINLRVNNDLPSVRLARGIRVYLAEDVLQWVHQRR